MELCANFKFLHFSAAKALLPCTHHCSMVTAEGITVHTIVRMDTGGKCSAKQLPYTHHCSMDTGGEMFRLNNYHAHTTTAWTHMGKCSLNNYHLLYHGSIIHRQVNVPYKQLPCTHHCSMDTGGTLLCSVKHYYAQKKDYKLSIKIRVFIRQDN